MVMDVPLEIVTGLTNADIKGRTPLQHITVIQDFVDLNVRLEVKSIKLLDQPGLTKPANV